MWNSCTFLLLSAVLLGPVEQPAVRTWTDATGKYRIEARFVDVQQEAVRLRKADGTVIAVPLVKLSTADREHVERLIEKPADGAKEAAAEKPAPAAEPAPVKTPPKTGRFETSFTEYSPMSSRNTLMPRMAAPSELSRLAATYQQKLGAKFNAEHFYKAEEQTWQVYVPQDYDGSLPYGLFVFINSGDSGSPPGDWLPILKSHRLIFIGPDKAGNDVDIFLLRGPLALDAVHNMAKQYEIDPARIYISGNSGGGRLASRVAMAFPDVFTGAQYHVGADDPSITAAGSAARSPLAATARNRGRYVFITGDKDMNRAEMETIAKRMTSTGFRFVTYLQIPGHGHAAPPAEWFEKGITALDAPLRESAKAQFETAQQALERQQWGRALPALQAAAAHGADEPFAAEALGKLKEVKARFDADVAALEELVADGDLAAASRQLVDFQKRWSQAGQTDAKRFRETIKEARRAR